MSLSNDLVSQFVKTTIDEGTSPRETTVYGTTVVVDDTTWVKLDGSDLLTPISTTAVVKDGERVTVMIKDHSAVITGNMTSPSASSEDVKEQGKQLSEFEIVLADKVSTEQLIAEVARITKLEADNVTVTETLTANAADIETLEADNATINEKLVAHEADISYLETQKLDAEVAELTYATIDDLDATNADIHNLNATYADFESATAKNFEAANARIDKISAGEIDTEALKANFAQIDFANIGEAAIKKIFGETGIIKDLVVGDQTITGELVGVTISGDLIKGNTVMADKLVIKGSDGLYYKLNINALGETAAGKLSAEEQEALKNGLHGSNIIAKTITAEKITVKDLVAFGATIGGYNITSNALYSGVKSSATNTTRGVYLDSDGQFAVGDSSNYMRFYKNSSGTYLLEISASSIKLGTGGSLEDSIGDVNDKVDNISVGGRNLLLNSGVEYSNNDYSMAGYVPSSPLIAGTEYTVSMCVTPATGVESYKVFASGGYSVLANLIVTGTGKQVLSATFFMSYYEGRTPDDDPVYANIRFYRLPDDGTVTENSIVHWVKVEKGNKATDWTPAPEDMASTENVADVRDIIEGEGGVNDRVGNAESLIQQLSNSIEMLVTDGNGTSLMTQTENGWTFSTKDIQDRVNGVSENLDSLTTEIGNTNNVVDVLQDEVEALGVIGEYIHIGTIYNEETGNDEPCIELGEMDSDFKLIITNTRIMFQEGSNSPAYITNKSLYITKAVIKEELQQGEFVWKARSNGNLGLIWKGGTS